MSAKATLPPPPKPQAKASIPKAPTPEKPAAESTTPRKSRRSLKVFFVVASTVLILLLAAATTYAFYYSSRYLPRTFVAGVNIGGMNQAEAQQAISAKESAFLAQSLTISYGGTQADIKPATIHSTFTTQPVLDSIWQEQKGGGVQSQLHQLVVAPFRDAKYVLGFTAVDADGQASLQTTIFTKIETPYKETTLNFNPGAVTINAGKAGTQVDTDQLETDLYTAFTTGDKNISLALKPFAPEVTPAMAGPARSQAEQLLQSPITVQLGTGKTAAITPADLASWLTTTVTHDVNGVATGLALGLKNDLASARITSWATQVNLPAKNAQLQHTDAGVSVVTADQSGQSLDQAATLANLQQLVVSGLPAATLTAVVATTPADVTATNLAALGINTLIGSNTTDFSSSPTNRIINITTGQKALNGILVKPGDTFSTVKHLTPITGANGYVPELVIKGNTLVDEDGGGLCQVSTTLFRSVLSAGLPIVQRVNHSFRVGYYEAGTGPGLDATIYDPSPDFKWKNDTGFAIYVQSSITGHKLTFDLYGTSDGRVATIGKPQILATYPVGPPIYTNTDTLDVGVTKQIEHAVNGAKVTVSYVVTRNGQNLENTTFVSNYVAWPAQYEVGTHDPGPVATPTPTPTPTP